MKLYKQLKLFRFIWPYAKANPIPFAASLVTMPVLTLIQAGQPIFIQKMVDLGIIAKDHSHLILYSIVFLGLIILEYGFKFLQSISSNLFVQKMIHAIRLDFSRHVLSQKALWHDKNLSGTLVSRATSDLDNLSEAISTGLLSSLLDLITLAGAMIAMWHLAPSIAILVFFMMPLCLVSIRYFSRKIKFHIDDSRKATANLSSWTQESLYGVQSIKALSAETWAEGRYQKFNKDFKTSQLKYVFFDASLFSVLEGFAAITLGIILWQATGKSDVITVGVLIAFVKLSSQVFDPLKQLGQTMAMLQGVFSSLERIKSILDNDQQIKGSITQVEGTLNVSNLSFAYSPDQPEILKNISFQLKKGQSLALVGKTGSGKSTLAKLLIRLYDGYKGSIKFGEVEVSSIEPHSLRQKIVSIPQDVAIFEGSLLFNISLGRSLFSTEDIEQVFIKLGGERILQKLEEGIHSPLTEGGSTLSQGERQLIAFARALVLDPSIVILDEATSSIDQESEEIVQKAIDVVLKQTTTIVIAHRLSTIEHCDQIIVLEQGAVVEQGNHRTLMENEGAYYRQVLRKLET
jgi:ABC-type multidrug transport system fused ATPase/permease subunit